MALTQEEAQALQATVAAAAVAVTTLKGSIDAVAGGAPTSPFAIAQQAKAAVDATTQAALLVTFKAGS